MNAIAVVPDDSSACPRPARLLAAACLMPGLLCPAGVFAAETPQPTPTSSLEEHVQVTATRIPEKTGTTPVSITVITRDDLIRRGAYDLRSALSLATGLDIAPGGDGGPAGYVPEFWGLKEFDAFLLAVDGVPWGGAFNPALTTLDLNDVDRIEILRGAAPVMYGATSFVGVINVIHRAPGEGGPTLRTAAGSYGSGSAAWSAPVGPARLSPSSPRPHGDARPASCEPGTRAGRSRSSLPGTLARSSSADAASTPTFEARSVRLHCSSCT